jgi:hypothetical protein
MHCGVQRSRLGVSTVATCTLTRRRNARQKCERRPSSLRLFPRVPPRSCPSGTTTEPTENASNGTADPLVARRMADVFQRATFEQRPSRVQNTKPMRDRDQMFFSRGTCRAIGTFVTGRGQLPSAYRNRRRTRIINPSSERSECLAVRYLTLVD